MDVEKSIKSISRIWKIFGGLYIILYLIIFLLSLVKKDVGGIFSAGPFVKTWIHSTWWMHIVIGVAIRKRHKVALKVAYLLSGVYVAAVIASGLVLSHFQFSFLKMSFFDYYG